MRILSRLALLGALAVGGAAASTVTASAQCSGAGGGMDCPLAPPYTLNSQPYVNPNSVVPPGPDVYVPSAPARDYDRPRRHSREYYRPRSHDRFYGSYDPYYRGYYDDRYVPRYYEERRYYEPRYEPRRRVMRLTAEHVDYCYAKYRSYRASDNTYKPKRGPRRQCTSPYI